MMIEIDLRELKVRGLDDKLITIVDVPRTLAHMLWQIAPTIEIDEFSRDLNKYGKGKLSNEGINSVLLILKNRQVFGYSIQQAIIQIFEKSITK